MLSFVRLVNFKCFEELELRCAPLTLLCGLNGMGKSSVIQALLLLCASRGSESLKLNAENVDLGTSEDVLYEGAETDSISFELRWSGERPFVATYNKSKDGSRLVGTDTGGLVCSDHREDKRVPISEPPIYVSPIVAA